MKPNWSCPTCGMFSSRRYSVQRHIDSKHRAQATPIPFVQYLAGYRNGFYPPRSKPSFQPKQKSIQDKITEEAENALARRVADEFIRSGDPEYYSDCVKMFKLNLKNCGIWQNGT